MKKENTFLSNLQLRVDPWKPVVLLVVAIVCMVFYLYLNRQDAYRLIDPNILFPFPGDLSAYAVRFLSSALLFGIVPVAVALFMGYRLNFLGFRFKKDFLFSRIFWILLILAPAVSIVGGLSTDLYNFYPFSHTLITLYPEHPGILALHGVLYFTLYYIPWEILFRGILVFPFLPPETVVAKDSPSPATVFAAPAILVVASWQILPTVIMHLPNPMIEALGAIPFGLICAYLAVRFRSIVPGLIIHAAAGISVDFAIILRHNA